MRCSMCAQLAAGGPCKLARSETSGLLCVEALRHGDAQTPWSSPAYWCFCSHRVVAGLLALSTT